MPRLKAWATLILRKFDGMIDGAVILVVRETGASLSTIEAEFIAASQADGKFLGLRK